MTNTLKQTHAMTRAINLLSLTQAKLFLDQDGYEKYVGRYGIEMRAGEIDDIYSFVEQLREGDSGDLVFDRYYVGYKISQIGKEFDLLRFGENYHLNIEIKSDFDIAKMRRQLRRNKYFLGHLGLDVFFISYSSLNKKFFLLTPEEEVVEVSREEIIILLASQEIEESISIDDRFNPSSYLVSPFNSPDKFLRGEYFLTSQQEGVKRNIMELFRNSESSVYVSLTGAAGTGKTLLAYDIVADLKRSGRSPLIVHCGKLNDGHIALVDSGWQIISIRDMFRQDLSRFSPILLDEAQRIRPQQFDHLVGHINSIGGQCFFSYDRSQTLADYETRNDIGARIEAISGITIFSISEKIRTNMEIANFIKSFFNFHRGIKVRDNGSIELVYFNSYDDAIRHLMALDGSKWTVIKFTPSQYQREHHETYSAEVSTTSHDVIGQEFDGVAVMVDEFFTYNRQGSLVYTGQTYYQPAKMLFQNMTRARSKLMMIIINNSQILRTCMEIFE